MECEGDDDDADRRNNDGEEYVDDYDDYKNSNEIL